MGNLSVSFIHLYDLVDHQFEKGKEEKPGVSIITQPPIVQSVLEGPPTVTHSNYSWELQATLHLAGVSLIPPQTHGHFNLIVWNWNVSEEPPQNLIFSFLPVRGIHLKNAYNLLFYHIKVFIFKIQISLSFITIFLFLKHISFILLLVIILSALSQWYLM